MMTQSIGIMHNNQGSTHTYVVVFQGKTVYESILQSDCKRFIQQKNLRGAKIKCLAALQLSRAA